jgi:hypothetical protein
MFRLHEDAPCRGFAPLAMFNSSSPRVPIWNPPKRARNRAEGKSRPGLWQTESAIRSSAWYPGEFEPNHRKYFLISAAPLRVRQRAARTTTPSSSPSELPPADPRHRLHAVSTQADWALRDHAPAPPLLGEQPGGYLTYRAAVIDAAKDRELGPWPRVANGRWGPL